MRGISNKKNELTDEGYICSAVYSFPSSVGECRKDNYKELSVNWEDDDNAINVLLNQKKIDKNGVERNQFESACRVNMATLKMVCNHFLRDMNLSFERAPIRGNPYHGNILLLDSVSKQTRTLISNALASISRVVD